MLEKDACLAILSEFVAHGNRCEELSLHGVKKGELSPSTIVGKVFSSL